VCVDGVAIGSVERVVGRWREAWGTEAECAEFLGTQTVASGEALHKERSKGCQVEKGDRQIGSPVHYLIFDSLCIQEGKKHITVTVSVALKRPQDSGQRGGKQSAVNGPRLDGIAYGLCRPPAVAAGFGGGVAVCCCSTFRHGQVDHGREREWNNMTCATKVDKRRLAKRRGLATPNLDKHRFDLSLGFSWPSAMALGFRPWCVLAFTPCIIIRLGSIQVPAHVRVWQWERAGQKALAAGDTSPRVATKFGAPVSWLKLHSFRPIL
jgi:hypothetical protein